MKRREFITLLVGGAAAWPLAAHAQQAGKIPRIGYLGSSSPALEPHYVEAFGQKLRDLGYVDGANIAIEYRWAEGQDDRLPSLATELVRLKPDIIVTTGTPGTLAAMRRQSGCRGCTRTGSMWTPADSCRTPLATSNCFAARRPMWTRFSKGAKPGELPIQEPTKFELIVNLKNAKAIDIEVATSLLLRADQLIE